jgi:hypothetical protein
MEGVPVAVAVIIEDDVPVQASGKRDREPEEDAQPQSEPRKRTFQDKIREAQEQAREKERRDIEEYQDLLLRHPLPKVEAVAERWVDAIEKMLLSIIVEKPDTDWIMIEFFDDEAFIKSAGKSPAKVRCKESPVSYLLSFDHRLHRASKTVINAMCDQVLELMIRHLEQIEGLKVRRIELLSIQTLKHKIELTWTK